MRVIWDIFIGDVRNLFRNVIAAIAVMGLARVPPMYAWFTTLGFWDPYSNTGNIKVAVASEDAGYTSDLIPTPINAGEQIIGKLRARAPCRRPSTRRSRKPWHRWPWAPRAASLRS